MRIQGHVYHNHNSSHVLCVSLLHILCVSLLRVLCVSLRPWALSHGLPQFHRDGGICVTGESEGEWWGGAQWDQSILQTGTVHTDLWCLYSGTESREQSYTWTSGNETSHYVHCREVVLSSEVLYTPIAASKGVFGYVLCPSEVYITYMYTWILKYSERERNATQHNTTQDLRQLFPKKRLHSRGTHTCKKGETALVIHTIIHTPACRCTCNHDMGQQYWPFPYPHCKCSPQHASISLLLQGSCTRTYIQCICTWPTIMRRESLETGVKLWWCEAISMLSKSIVYTTIMYIHTCTCTCHAVMMQKGDFSILTWFARYPKWVYMHTYMYNIYGMLTMLTEKRLAYIHVHCIHMHDYSIHVYTCMYTYMYLCPAMEG